MAEAGVHQYGNIYLGSRGGVSQGQLRVTPSGFHWRRAGGGGSVDVKKEDISGLVWTKVPRGCQLGVRRAAGPTVNFLGFRDKDYEALAQLCQSSFGHPLAEQALSTSGRNWGALTLHGSSLAFLVDGKPTFELPLPDVSQAQQAKDEVMLEFGVDDTGDKEDALVEVAFHVPPGYDTAGVAAAPADGEAAANSAKLVVDALLAHTDAGAATSDDAVAIFDDVAVLLPRGRFEVEMHSGFLKLVGQTQDFKIRYTSVVRIFILPKSSTPHTLVVVSLDPPIRKGQTFYSHLLCQFDSHLETSVELDISEEALAQKNEKCGGKLTRVMSGSLHEVFARTLRGLSGAKLTRPGSFRAADGESCAVRCSYKADDGYLYPLERGFFYIHKPPLLVLHEDIESVEFQRQGGGVLSSSVRTFDLVMRLRSANTPELQFRSIQRTEWQGLFDWMVAKRINISNLASARQGPGGGGGGIDLGDEMDAGMRAAVAEADEDESDEDFDAGAGSGSEESSDEDGSDDASNASDSDASDDAELVDEEGIDAAALGGKKRKAVAPAEPKPKAPKKTKAAAEGAGEGGKAARKPRKKKDPAAPKKALSAFMYYSQANRDRVKADNPGISFGQVGKLLGEQWKALPTEERAPYEAQAAADKERYAAAMVEYKSTGGGAGAGAAAGDGGGDDDWGSDREEAGGGDGDD